MQKATLVNVLSNANRLDLNEWLAQTAIEVMYSW